MARHACRLKVGLITDVVIKCECFNFCADISFGIALDSNLPRLLSLGQDRVLVLCTFDLFILFLNFNCGFSRQLCFPVDLYFITLRTAD